MWPFRDREESEVAVRMADCSAEVFGRYQHCIKGPDGLWYSDLDMDPSGKPRRGARPAPDQDQPEIPEETRRKLVAETHATLERLAQEAEQAVLDQTPSLWEEAQAEYRRDVDGYNFSCSRVGEFLTVQIDRFGNPSEGPPRQHVETIRLGMVQSLLCKPGHAPDQEGEVTYGFCLKHNGGGMTIGATGFGNHPTPQGCEWVVRPRLFRPPRYRRPFHVQEQQSMPTHRVVHMPDTSYRIEHKTSGCPRAAEDDEVWIRGLNATIFAPAGHGGRVIRSIAEATEFGIG